MAEPFASFNADNIEGLFIVMLLALMPSIYLTCRAQPFCAG